MSTSDVLRLEEYRGRREQRLHRTLALNRGDPIRSLVLDRLREILNVVPADRAAVVWVDEYAEMVAQPYAVLDIGATPPRRSVGVDALIRSWEVGVPALVPTEAEPSDGGGQRWVVSLGSDGLRLWFVFVEARRGAPPAAGIRREALMFLAGECAAILLHRDLDTTSDADWLDSPGGRFGAAAVEALEADVTSGPGGAARRAVAALARFLLNQGPASDLATFGYRLEMVAHTLREPGCEAPEGPEQVLESARSDDPAGVAKGLIVTARGAEEDGGFKEAAELYGLAYETACFAGAVAAGGRAARGRARCLRRMARWDEALGWYDVAGGIARSLDDVAEEAVVLDGVASVHLGRGSLPTARAVLESARALAEGSGDPDAVAAIQFSLMTVAHTEGRLEEAAAHGWSAVRGFRDRGSRLRALTALGGVFLAGRSLDAAEDAFVVVERESSEQYYRLYALAGLARIQAARRDRAAFERALRRLDRAGFAQGAPEFRAEALLERGDAYLELGDSTAARRSYREAVRVAERHRVSEYLIRAEAALTELDEAGGEGTALPVPGPVMAERTRDLDAVRRGLADLRREGIGVGG